MFILRKELIIYLLRAFHLHEFYNFNYTNRRCTSNWPLRGWLHFCIYQYQIFYTTSVDENLSSFISKWGRLKFALGLQNCKLALLSKGCSFKNDVLESKNLLTICSLYFSCSRMILFYSIYNSLTPLFRNSLEKCVEQEILIIPYFVNKHFQKI